MPRPKIIDEWTNRTDLSATQKWYRRHPEHKAVRAREQREYTLKYPDRADASVKAYRSKIKLKKAAKMNRIRDGLVFVKGSCGLGKRNEIIRLHQRGKDCASIAIWLHIPMSTVSKVISSQNGV